MGLSQMGTKPVWNNSGVLQPLVGSIGSSLSLSAPPRLSVKLSLSRSNSELVDISIAQSNQQKDQLLLAFEFYQGTFNHHSFSNRTFRFARQYNGPTKPSPAPTTIEPDTVESLFFLLKTVHNYAYCSVTGRAVCAWLSEAQSVCVYSGARWTDTRPDAGVSWTVFLGVEKLWGPLTHLSSLISLWKMRIDRNTNKAAPSFLPVGGRAPMWKKKLPGESWEEHGSSGLCHKLLPSVAPHDMAGWQRASQSFHVSQTRA